MPLSQLRPLADKGSAFRSTIHSGNCTGHPVTQPHFAQLYPYKVTQKEYDGEEEFNALYNKIGKREGARGH